MRWHDYLQQHVNDPRRVRDADGGYTSVDAEHRVLVWEGPTWSPDGDRLDARPGTPCADYGSHCFVSGVCADCGLEIPPPPRGTGSEFHDAVNEERL